MVNYFFKLAKNQNDGRKTFDMELATETPPPETTEVSEKRVSCNGGDTLGHPLVWFQIGDEGYVDCSYCDRRFILKEDLRN